MAGVDYALNGVALDSQYCRVTLGSTLFAGVSVSRSKVSAPFRHGTIPSGFAPSFEERSVTLKVTAFRAGALAALMPLVWIRAVWRAVHSTEP